MRSQTTRRALVRRMRSTAAGELACCVLFPLVFFGVRELPITVGNVAGTVVAIVLLLQGAIYWLLKARSLHGDTRSIGEGWLGVFTTLRTANMALLVGSLGLIARSIATAGVAAGAFGLAMWLLAVLEYVNYFHRQLTYGRPSELSSLFRSGLKRSALARDLRRHQSRTTDGL